MTTSDGVLFISIFNVRPDNQQALIDCLREGASHNRPGLISASLLRSRDGAKVINHMVWESQEAFVQAMRTNPAITATRQRVYELIDGPAEGAAPGAYEVIELK